MLEIALRLFKTYCFHGDGVYKVSWPYALLSGYYVVIVINCLRHSTMAMVMMGGQSIICCCHYGDGSAGRHVCTKYHYYQQLIAMLEM